NVTAASPIAACRSAQRLVLLTAPGNNPVAAVAGANLYTNLIDEVAHGLTNSLATLNLTARPGLQPTAPNATPGRFLGGRPSGRQTCLCHKLLLHITF